MGVGVVVTVGKAVGVGTMDVGKGVGVMEGGGTTVGTGVGEAVVGTTMAATGGVVGGAVGIAGLGDGVMSVLQAAVTKARAATIVIRQMRIFPAV